ncbi:MAG: hypothetical protein AAFV19_10735 [Pseudomonadota bacterium]
MIILLEAAWLGILLFVVWILFRAARARPDDAEIRWAARIALAAWSLYAAIRIFSGDTLEMIGRNLSTLAVLLLIALAIGAYVVALGYLRGRAERE